MIATNVNTPSGLYSFKSLGADQVVKANRAALDGLLRSMKPSDG